MALKFRPSIISSNFRKLDFIGKYFSSISSAVHNHDYPESYQKIPNSAEINPRTQYLRSRSCPDERIRVLDRIHDLNSVLKVPKLDSLQKQFRHTDGTYSSIILKLGFSGNMDEMEALCRDMVKDRCPGTEQVLGALVDVLVGNGRLDAAMRVVLVMNSGGFKLSIIQWNSLLCSLVEGKREFFDVLLIYKEMVKSRTIPNVDTLNHLIQALFDANMADKALDQFRRMQNKRCFPNCKTFENVILGLVASGQVIESLSILNEMFENGVDLDLSFYTHVIPCFCIENKLREAMRLFGMLKASKFQPGLHIYESLTNCLYANCHFSEVVELFLEIRNSGFSPSTDLVTDVSNAYCKLGNLDEARNLLADYNVRDPTPYSVLLQCYFDSHNFLAAKQLFCEMFLLNVADNLSWNIIIRLFCHAKNVKQAYELLGKMIVSSCVPDSTTYSSFVIGMCNLSKYEDAMKLFHLVSRKDWILDPDSYVKLIEGLCNVDKFHKASEVFIYMSAKDCTLHCSLFSGLIKGICATGRIEEAIQLLKSGHYSENPVNTSVYTTAMHSLLKQNRPNDSIVFLPQILKRGLVIDAEAYCVFIECMVAIQETKCCVLFLNMMVGEGLVPNVETFTSLFSYLLSHCGLHMIWTTINKLCQENEFSNPAMYNAMIHALWKESYRTEACQLLDYMLDKGWVPDADTHGLLTGSSSCKDEKDRSSFNHTSLDMQDEVTNILSEGLGET